ncbi:MAG: hypothetical protein ACLUNZ_06255 [Evtepia sp.]
MSPCPAEQHATSGRLAKLVTPRPDQQPEDAGTRPGGRRTSWWT